MGIKNVTSSKFVTTPFLPGRFIYLCVRQSKHFYETAIPIKRIQEANSRPPPELDTPVDAKHSLVNTIRDSYPSSG